MSDDPAPQDVRGRFLEVFEGCAETGLIEIGETDLTMTPLGAQCLDEMLVYLSQHPRPDVAKRAGRLRDAVHRR